MKSKKDYKIAIVIGTRAELIKTFPVMIELKKRNTDYYFIHTGQHSLGDLCEKFGVKKPDTILYEEPKKTSRFNSKNIKAGLWVVSLIKKIRSELRTLPNLRYVLYHGDTMTTASAAIGSSKMLNPFKKYKSVHLEAGLRSFNNFEPFPEELFRRITGKFSNVLIAVSDCSVDNLKNLKKKRIICYGNTIIDSAYQALELAKKQKIKRLDKKDFGLVTVHRHENLVSRTRMEKIIGILSEINIPTYFAVHDNTLEKLEKFGLLEKLKSLKNVKLIKPMDYVSFIYQVSECNLIVCDGGSMQEESLIFAKPCVILRYSTERPEGLETNFQFLSKLNIEESSKKIKEYLNPKFKIKSYKNPYGEKGLSKKIVEFLVR